MPPGKIWLKADYGRAELAWLAWNTQDPLMMEWASKELDQHEQRGMAIFMAITGKTKADWEAMKIPNPKRPGEMMLSPDQDFYRKKGKTQNFATVYLEEPGTTAAKTMTSIEEIIADLEMADKLHPKVRELKMEVFETCQRGGLIRTTFGRRRSASALGWEKTHLTAEQWVSHDRDNRNARNRGGNMSIFRSLWNTRAAQADASDTTFVVGTRIHKLLQSGDWLDPERVKMISWDHDDLGFEVEEDATGNAAAEIHRAMRDIKAALPPGVQFDLPLPVDVEIGKSLGELEKVKVNYAVH